jgi:hypothetical protein
LDTDALCAVHFGGELSNVGIIVWSNKKHNLIPSFLSTFWLELPTADDVNDIGSRDGIYCDYQLDQQ